GGREKSETDHADRKRRPAGLVEITERTLTIRSAAPILLVVGLTAVACGKKTPPVARPAPPPVTTASNASTRPPAPPETVAEPTVVPPEPAPGDSISSASLDDLNRSSPLKHAFFEYDSAELAAAAHA